MRLPTTAGVILARDISLAGIEKIIAEDPFLRTGAVTYEVIEIEPTRSVVPELAALHQTGS